MAVGGGDRELVTFRVGRCASQNVVRGVLGCASQKCRPGTSAAARALPPSTAGQPLRTFEVLKPFEVEVGPVAPAFGQLGFGTQFRTPVRLKVLLERGII